MTMDVADADAVDVGEAMGVADTDCVAAEASGTCDGLPWREDTLVETDGAIEVTFERHIGGLEP